MSLNHALAARMGSLTMKTKTSVMNEAEINNIIVLNPFLTTLSIELDGNIQTTSREKPDHKKFSQLEKIIFASDPFDRGGTQIQGVAWLAHKLDNRSIDTVNTMLVSPADNHVVYTFIQELQAVHTLVTRWDQFEILLSQYYSQDVNAMALLDTITYLEITITADAATITSEFFDWLHNWAKSTTR